VGENRKFPKAIFVGKHDYPVMRAVPQGLKSLRENWKNPQVHSAMLSGTRCPQGLKGMCENRDLGI
jgi:hypothetical protein